ncbi:hypothetical protein C440_04938 [Haloferax mucosum ATCC BAA-1512]|uniref:Uncharacterized protein n=1 Tax=Haloferax mucosum ATCC BAA-1512 TaxID=662479 RepID=M0II74_9EURY|nr:hypothetical protein [Haloferax mucosum]ELZ96465.1 hypothetical protein C440_04938 [Haloferax mucosum ATCC BAA-1512]
MNRAFALLLAAFVATVSLGGIGIVAAQSDETDSDSSANTTATAEGAPDKYLAEIDDGVYIVDYQFVGDDEVAVTWWISPDAAPVSVQYADVGGTVRGEPGVRTPAVQTDAILRTGEVTTRYPATDGPAGQITQISVDGQPVVIEGEGTGGGDVLSTIEPTPALILGAIGGVAVTGLVAYRSRTKELEEPVKAHEVWRRK